MKDAYNKFMTEVYAAGVNRIYKWCQQYDCGTISASRLFESVLYEQLGRLEVQAMSYYEKKDWLVRNEVNKANDMLLRLKIKQAKYAYIQVQGNYQEEGADHPVKELSYFVFDYKQKGGLKEWLIKTAFFFDQDIITYADAGQDFSLYETTPFYEIVEDYTKGPYRRSKPSGKKIAYFKGKMDKHISQISEEQTYSRIRGRGFYWDNYTAVKVNPNPPIMQMPGEIGPNQVLSSLAFLDTCPRITNDNYDYLFKQ